MRRVRVRNVWQWKCLNCGTDRIEQGEPMPLDDYDEEIREAIGLQPWEDVDLDDVGVMVLPSEVECDCGARFATYVGSHK